MKIVHITTSNRGGGAAIAAVRHSEALQRKGFNSVVLAEKGVSQAGSRILGFSIFQRYLDAFLFYFIKSLKRVGLTWSLLLFGKSIIKEKEVVEADVIILHYINDFLNYKAIDELLASGKRIVWYMHDMWTITGGCHNALECNGYMKDCKNCPQLSHCKWLAHWQFNQKKNIFKTKQLIAATPSKWLANCVKYSSLFQGAKVYVCPNVINTDVYKPMDKIEARKKLALEPKRKYILFGAAAINSLYKGMGYVYETLVRLPLDYEFLVLGHVHKEELPVSIQNRTYIMGYVNEDERKRMIYSAADLFLITSVAENYPNMVIESMACGTPAVGFMTGGIIEQIEDRETGCLASVGDIDGLVEGIEWVENNNKEGVISNKARRFVVENCSYEIIDKLYAPLLQD